MLDQLISLVRQHAGDAIVNNQAVPNEHNEAAIQDVAQQIFHGLKGQVGQGNVQSVMSMFSGGGSSLTSNPVVSQITSSLVSSLAAKFGVSSTAANQIASSLIPQVMNQFVNKTNDPNDRDFDLQDMMRNFTGNSGFDVGGILGQVTGRSGGAGNGGLGDTLGKLFG